MASTPPAEFVIDEPLIRTLLHAQAPEFANLPLRRVAAGWDNEMWRLGDEHVVRIPRRAQAEPLIEHEHRWLPRLAATLPVAVPVPVVAGQPTAQHPRRWTVGRWLPGEPLADRPGSAALAGGLADFLAALHQPAPVDAPVNDWRGVDLGARADRVEMAIGVLRRTETATADQIMERWATLIAAPIYDGEPVWVHGDLHPLNLLVDDDTLTAVIDFGDLTSGDPASDLAVAWMAFEPIERHQLQTQLAHVDPATWARAQAWALALGTIVVVNSDDDPLLERVGRTAIRRVLVDQPPI